MLHSVTKSRPSHNIPSLQHGDVLNYTASRSHTCWPFFITSELEND